MDRGCALCHWLETPWLYCGEIALSEIIGDANGGVTRVVSNIATGEVVEIIEVELVVVVVEVVVSSSSRSSSK